MATSRLSKQDMDDAIFEYLKLGGVSDGILQQARSELSANWAEGSSMATCKLTRVFNYAADGTLEVQVSRLSGETDTFEVRQWTSVQDLKAEIEARMEIPIGEQVLLKGGQELKSFDECLAAYRVTLFSSALEVLRVEAKNSPEAVGGLQVSLRAADGIPEGSIISFRAGSKGRQVPLRFDQTFTFPVTKEAANPFKIDVFSQFGKARLTLRPAESVYRAEIEGPLGGLLGVLEFEVRDTAERERHYKHPSPPQPTRVSKRAQRTVLASRYLDEHGLLTYMQGVIQSVLHDKPADPYDYMIRQMQAAKKKPDSAASSTAAPSEASAAAAASTDAPTSAEDAENTRLREENTKLKAEVSRLTEETSGLREQLTSVQGELAALRAASASAATAAEPDAATGDASAEATAPPADEGGSMPMMAMPSVGSEPVETAAAAAAASAVSCSEPASPILSAKPAEEEPQAEADSPPPAPDEQDASPPDESAGAQEDAAAAGEAEAPLPEEPAVAAEAVAPSADDAGAASAAAEAAPAEAAPAEAASPEAEEAPANVDAAASPGAEEEAVPAAVAAQVEAAGSCEAGAEEVRDDDNAAATSPEVAAEEAPAASGDVDAGSGDGEPASLPTSPPPVEEEPAAV